MDVSLTESTRIDYPALTIKQPWASLLCAGMKRVENRSRLTKLRGTLLVHSAKRLADEWSEDDDAGLEQRAGELERGAIVGAVDIVDCVPWPVTDIYLRSVYDGKYDWLKTHEYATGPWCWICDRAIRFERPVPYRGSQGMFRVAKELVADQLRYRASPPSDSSQ